MLIKEVIEFDARRDIHRATTVVSTVRNFHVGKIAHYTEGLKIVIRKVNLILVEIPQSSVSTCTPFYETNIRLSCHVFYFPLKVNSGNNSKSSKTPEYLLKRRNSNQPSTKAGKNTNQSMP